MTRLCYWKEETHFVTLDTDNYPTLFQIIVTYPQVGIEWGYDWGDNEKTKG